MIYTLTLNPAVDMNVSSDRMEAGLVNRTYDTVYTPNGKGVNVSFTLQHFGIPSVVLGPFGGFTGDYITSECRNRGLTVLPSPIAGTNRVNMFVTVGDKEYKLVNEGPVVSPEEQESLLALLESLTDLEVLTINGSMARGFSKDYILRIMEICNRKQVKVVPDISTPMLKELLAYRPFLIKPNDEELMDIFALPATNWEEILAALKELYQAGAQNILLTMGDKGSYFYNGTECYHCEAHPVKLVSSACCGDGFLSAFLSIWLTSPDQVVEALKLAAATGANVAESAALGDFANVERYRQQIRVTKIV